ncbi:hypothetical protein BV22DRAFT_1035572, partial [Leucogyrophana mollusca]
MNSQITLVAPSTPTHASVTLEFERDVMTSTTITVRGNSTPCYSVDSARAGTFKPNLKTVIREGDRVLASVERRDMLPDQLSLHGSPPMALSKWLKSPITSSFPITFEESGRKYLWRRDSGGKLQLYMENANSDAIAWFHPSRLTFGADGGNRVLHPASLSLTPEADIMRETVLISCILVLQKMRAKERTGETAGLLTTQGLTYGILTASY